MDKEHKMHLFIGYMYTVRVKEVGMEEDEVRKEN
jgi:hypothetical protein